ARSYTLTNLSVSYQYLGEWAKAETLAREALDTEEQVHGTRSLAYGNIMRNYASIIDELGRKQEADSLIRISLDVLHSVVGTEHVDYLRSVHMLAFLRYAVDDMEGTVASAREVVAGIGTVMHESEPSAGSTLQVLGLALDSLGRYAEADSALRRSLE